MLLTTIGYEGLDVNTFFDILQQNKIETLVDIRELPLSRKRGFSKSALINNAEIAGINYVHISELGAPRNVRHEYRDDEDWQRFSERYKAYLHTQQEPLDQLAELVSRCTCCLMCFEADYRKCHRSYVTNALWVKFDGELQVNHLGQVRTMVPVWHSSLAGIPIQR